MAKKICLVLGGGGARGFSHIGVIKVLEKNNIIPNYIVGVSMGAAIGGLYALGTSLEEIEKICTQVRKRDMAKLLDFNLPGRPILKGEKVLKFIEKYTGDKTFKDLKIPFLSMATNLENGKEVMIRGGKVSEAIRASISVPGIFSPQIT